MIERKYTYDRCQANIKDGLVLIDRAFQNTERVEQATKVDWFSQPRIHTDGTWLFEPNPGLTSFHICKDCNDRLTKFMEPNAK